MIVLAVAAGVSVANFILIAIGVEMVIKAIQIAFMEQITAPANPANAPEKP